MPSQPRVQQDDWTGRFRSITTSFALAIGGFVAANALVLVALLVLSSAGLPVRRSQTLQYLTATVVTGAGFVGVVAIYLGLSDRSAMIGVRAPTLREVGIVLLGVLTLLGALVTMNVVFDQLGVTTASHQVESAAAEDPRLPLILVPLAVLVIGPSEELLFRGAIQGRLRESYRAVPAIAIASVMFAVGHITALIGPGKGATILIILLLGAILGGVYEYTDNIVVPALVHGLYNAIAFLHIYAVATGAV